MGPVLLAAAVVALVIAAPFVSRRLRFSRVAPAAGAAAVPPVRPEPAGGMAVPVVTDLPDRDERAAFAYDNGLKTGEAARQ
jgi:hypothetical protein